MLNTQFQNHKHQIKPSLKQLKVTIIIDAFRAFATASYALEHSPKIYMLATKSSVISKLASNLKNTLLIGKPEKGSSLIYNIPNSPIRVQEIKIHDKNILHRTEAGAKGILLAKDSDIILAAGFVKTAGTGNYANFCHATAFHICVGFLHRGVVELTYVIVGFAVHAADGQVIVRAVFAQAFTDARVLD